MSFECENWAARQEVRPAARKFVLFLLASMSRGDGSCWGPQARLARFTGQSERAVRQHLAALEEAAYLRRYERRSTKDGHRLADGFLLDPLGTHGLAEFLADGETLAGREAPGKTKPRDAAGGRGAGAPADNPALPADPAARPTGRSCTPNRQISSALPADPAGDSIENPQGSITESSGAPCGAADPDGTAPPDASPGWGGRFSGVRSFLIGIGNPPDEAAKAERAYELRIMRRKDLGPVEARLVLWHLLRAIHAEGRTATPIKARLVAAIDAETGERLHLEARAAAEAHKYGGLGG